MTNRTRTSLGAIAIVASLLAGGFTGCGGGGGTAKKVDAVVVTYYYLPL